MNITRNNIDALNAEIKIAVTPQDYEARVNEGLKKVQRKASMPGFRPGKVPAGLIKKQYGNAILVDELNKLLDESLNKYIEENKLDILGHPLPKQQEKVDFEKQKEFEFVYELGLVPHFDVRLDNSKTFTYKKVKVDDELIDKYVKDVRKNYGEHIHPDSAGELDTLSVDINELDENGEIKAGGIYKTVNLQLEKIKGEKALAALIGAKKDDKIRLNVNDLYETDFDKSLALGIEREAASGLTSDLQLTVKSISRVNEAELDQQLFDRIYGEGKVSNEGEFRNKVREELGMMFHADAERFFAREVENKLVDEVNINLPDEFLKRWIAASNDKPITREEIEKEYPHYARAMKWQLIENRIIKDFGLKVNSEEATEEAKAYVRSEYSRYGYKPDDEQVEAAAKSILEKEKDRRKIYENLYTRKIVELVKEKSNIETVEVNYEEFFSR
jgi:trigger factor